jgi:hypothetical protein
MLLHRVIGQMDKRAEISQREGQAGRPYVAEGRPVTPPHALVGHHEHEMADIEFPAFVEKGLLEVLLQDEGHPLAVAVSLFLVYCVGYLAGPHYFYASALVGILSWLDYPKSLPYFFTFLDK